MKTEQKQYNVLEDIYSRNKELGDVITSMHKDETSFNSRQPLASFASTIADFNASKRYTSRANQQYQRIIVKKYSNSDAITYNDSVLVKETTLENGEKELKTIFKRNLIDGETMQIVTQKTLTSHGSRYTLEEKYFKETINGRSSTKRNKYTFKYKNNKIYDVKLITLNSIEINK